ncbi:MAG: DUF445 domain-containing protein [Gemmatimonadetes bacterium]|nr:DUF445 domain-containing protein [Gemmatimonadota bacterium]
MTTPAPLPAKNPFTPRADEAERREKLNAIKRLATGLLAFSGVVFVVATCLEARYPWMGYVRAFAEASLVGGLADWFAVTALFRRPLGLPIPHTAIVAVQKERIGRILGTFVQNHFLARELVRTRLLAMHPARRMAAWMSEPANAHRLSQQVAAGLVRSLEALPDDTMRELVREAVTASVRRTPAAALLGKTLSLVVAGNRHQELVDRAVELAAKAVQDNREFIREKVRAESPWWVPGSVDEKIYVKVFAAIDRLLREMGSTPDHPVRAAFDRAIHDFVDKLQNSPEMIARTEELKNEWLDDAAVTELSSNLWDTAKRGILRYAAAAEGPYAGPLERGIASFGETLLTNDALLLEIDGWIVDVAATVAEQNRQEVSDIIAQTVAAWDPDATVSRIELAVGRDLQFVRINGTLVGGLVGLAIYTVYRFWR